MLLKQGIGIINCVKFSRFCHCLKYNVDLKLLLHEVMSAPDFHGDLVNKLRRIIGRVVMEEPKS